MVGFELCCFLDKVCFWSSLGYPPGSLFEVILGARSFTIGTLGRLWKPWGFKNEDLIFDRFLGATKELPRGQRGVPERDKGRGKLLPLGIEDDLSGIEMD